MDTSKKYIQLCEKAQEIQDLWQYDDGDFYLHRFTENNLSDQRFKDMIGKDIVMTLCISCNVKDSYGDQYVSEYNPKGENVWLPRQDQLQNILCFKDFYADDLIMDTNGLSELMIGFRNFCDPWEGTGCMPQKVTVIWCEKEEEYIKQFTSMEQLWLAFVMKENFQKIWDGEKWISQ
jgi:hypothetical protein